MKKSIILLAGYPGTGKSYLCDQILRQEKDFVIISQDEIKERLFDEIGYDNIKEKEAITTQSWERYYQKMEDEMKQGIRLISDYPFSDKQKSRIKNLCDQYDYQVITIRLIADFDILYERQRKRDLDQNRHLSHIVSSYHLGDTMEDRSKADCLVSYDEFMNRCKNRGYGTFQLGYLIELDMSNFERVNYHNVLEELKKQL